MTVIFDYGDVISLPRSAADRAELERLAGIDPDALWAAYHAHRAGLDEGTLAPRAYWARIAADTGADWDLPRVHQLYAADMRSWISANPEVIAVLADLAAGGTPLAMISNAGPDYGSLLRHGALAPFFRACYVSGELGLLKPGPAIFRHALADLGIDASQAIFIDNREDNVAGAEAVGMTGHVFSSAAALRAFLAARQDGG